MSVVGRGDRRAQCRVRSNASRPLRPGLGVRRLPRQRAQTAGPDVLRAPVLSRAAASPRPRRRRPVPRLQRQVLPAGRRRVSER